MASEIISRADAKSKGLSRYFTGRPCKHGHVALRKTVNGVCAECSRDIEEHHREKHREKFQAKWRKASIAARKRDPEAYRLKDKKWRDANPTKVRLKKSRWRIEARGKYLAGEKRWREANPDKIRVKNKRYKTDNAERLAPIAVARTKQWCEENPERAKALRRKVSQHRRARILKATGAYTQRQIDDLVQSQNWTCATPRCLKSLLEAKELDHIIALARGGSNDISNLQWLCPSCNRKKQHKSPEEWALACEKLFPPTKDLSS
jgi:hypothetical protein